jgi:hypothetical protein
MYPLLFSCTSPYVFIKFMFFSVCFMDKYQYLYRFMDLLFISHTSTYVFIKFMYRLSVSWTSINIFINSCTLYLFQGPVPVPRAAHTAVRLKNVVYLFGGRHGDIRMNDLHSLELETLTWSGE